MKRTILLAAVALLVSSGTAVVNYSGPEGQPHIMGSPSGSSASGSAAAGPNGTEWRSTVEMRGRNPNISIGEEVENVSYSGNETAFSGHIQAPTPCHLLDQETERLGDQSYSINIKTMRDELDNQSQVCVQQVVMIRYDGSFKAEAPYTLEIQHNNQTVRTLENTVEEDNSKGEDDTQPNQGGVVSNFMNWLSQLF